MSDISEAAERLRPFIKQTPEIPGEGVECIWTLAKAWLSEHPADDDEAIDEAWLRSVGFIADAYEPSKSLSTNYCAPVVIRWTRRHRLLSLYDGESWCVLPGKTRGQLRRLCACLGITLTESQP